MTPKSKSHPRFRIMAVLGAVALTIAACGGDSVVGSADDPSDTTTATTAPAAAGGQADTTAPVATVPVEPDAGATITTVDSALGPIVANRDGRTLYVFDNDADGVSNCADQCAVNWPPVLAAGSPIAAGSIDATKLATIARADGGTQVTYFGRPLYHFAADAAPGDVLGQGVGGTWHVLDPAGTPILDAAPAGVFTLSVASTGLGDVLTGGPSGHTLYLFLGDEAGRPTPTCAGTCASNWPPLLLVTSGDDTEATSAGAGIDPSLIANVPHPDGGDQVTYNSWPVYFFNGDKAPGDTTGQSVGGKWFVIDAAGQPAGPGAPVITSQPGGTPVPTANSSILLDETSLGTIITDYQGLTLYAFEAEKPNLPTPACYDACAETWPPFLTDPAVFAGPGLDQNLIGSVERTDGQLQVTYNDWPLYYFAADEIRGDVKGQAVGNVWWVLDASGKLVKQ